MVVPSLLIREKSPSDHWGSILTGWTDEVRSLLVRIGGMVQSMKSRVKRGETLESLALVSSQASGGVRTVRRKHIL